MVVLRATGKVLKRLPPSVGDEVASDTALGDWYVNRIVVDRQPLLLFVSSGSLLAMLTPARNVSELPKRFANLVAARLQRLGVDERIIEVEVLAMTNVEVARTKDRSVMGTMVDFAKVLQFYLPEDGWDERDLRAAEDRFSETPCRCSGKGQETVWPKEKTIQLLVERQQVSSRMH